ncbi:MAG: P-loop NTPase fold protein [Candidatus Sulfobium sp.]
MSMHSLIDSVLAYVAEPETDYAILINGKWGSGKTFFVSHQLFKRLGEQYPELRLVHVSLSGLDNLDEIYPKILVGLLSNQASARIGSGLMKTLLQLDIKIPKIGITTKNIANVLKDTSLVIAKETKSKPDMFLCFDDLERISNKIEAEAVLGYIYANFIESKHTKVLLISDESKISASAYKEAKEKIIGRTFSFSPSMRDAFPQILEELVAEINRERIEAEKEFLFALLDSYKIRNLRTLQFIIRALDIISSAVPELKGDSFHKVTFFTTILSFEYRKGTLDLEDAYNLTNVETLSVLKSLSEKTEEKVKSYRDIFYDTYIKFHRNEYEYFRSIVDLVFSGYLDKDLFIVEIKSLEPQTLSIE